LERLFVKSFSAPLSLRPNPDVALPQTAMILAAGLGKRMRPLTTLRPKPLVEVAGRTLLDRVLDHVRSSAIAQTVVNVHYLADQVRVHLQTRAPDLDVRISDESDLLLETGGGVVKALPLIDADPFFVINADNMWIDGAVDTLRLLAQRWSDQEMDALLLLVPLARARGYEGPGDFHMDGMGRLRRRAGVRVAPYVFSGVQILSKRLFAGERIEPFSLNRIYNKAMAAGRLYGLAHQGLWFHVGTPQSVIQTELELGTR